MRRTVVPTLMFGLLGLGACSNSKTGDTCTVDSQCGKDVCANDQTCEPASDVSTVHVTWTISFQPASATSCAPLPALYLQFADEQGDAFGFIPVPCPEGEFTATKLPNNYDQVMMLDASTMTEEFGSAAISDGSAVMDLNPNGTGA